MTGHSGLSLDCKVAVIEACDCAVVGSYAVAGDVSGCLIASTMSLLGLDKPRHILDDGR